jgi:hypothetical protein
VCLGAIVQPIVQPRKNLQIHARETHRRPNRYLTGHAGRQQASKSCFAKVKQPARRMRRGYSNAMDAKHCKHGHPLTPANTYVRPDSYRQCRACLNANSRKWHRAHPERWNAYVRTWCQRLRQQVIAAYGGKCGRCGSTESLHLHHVNGNGAEHRKQISRNTAAICRWAARNNYPRTLALLCRACHGIQHRKVAA